jgi:hypothetical protein
MKTVTETKQEIVKHALSGGRVYGAAQHLLAFEKLADMFVANEIDKSTFAQAAKDICNLSQLQQKLEDAGLIDRNSRKAQSTNIFASLKA